MQGSVDLSEAPAHIFGSVCRRLPMDSVLPGPQPLLLFGSRIERSRGDCRNSNFVSDQAAPPHPRPVLLPAGQRVPARTRRNQDRRKPPPVKGGAAGRTDATANRTAYAYLATDADGSREALARLLYLRHLLQSESLHQTKKKSSNPKKLIGLKINSKLASQEECKLSGAGLVIQPRLHKSPRTSGVRGVATRLSL